MLLTIASKLTSDTSISVSLFLSCISALGVLYAIFRGRKSDSDLEKQRSIVMATNFAQLDVKLNGIDSKVSEVMKNYDKLDDKLDGFSDRLSRQDERINTLFRYHDGHEDRIQRLEGEKKNENK